MPRLPSFAARGTITIQDPGKRLVHGAEVDDWTNPGPPRQARGYAVPASTDELEKNRTSVRTGWHVWLHPETEIHATSKLTLPDGLDYGVDGDPQPYPSPSGGTSHIYVHAERWVG
jgi:hypothetical protein